MMCRWGSRERYRPSRRWIVPIRRGSGASRARRSIGGASTRRSSVVAGRATAPRCSCASAAGWGAARRWRCRSRRMRTSGRASSASSSSRAMRWRSLTRSSSAMAATTSSPSRVWGAGWPARLTPASSRLGRRLSDGSVVQLEAHPDLCAAGVALGDRKARGRSGDGREAETETV